MADDDRNPINDPSIPMTPRQDQFAGPQNPFANGTIGGLNSEFGGLSNIPQPSAQNPFVGGGGLGDMNSEFGSVNLPPVKPPEVSTTPKMPPGTNMGGLISAFMGGYANYIKPGSYKAPTGAAEKPKGDAFQAIFGKKDAPMASAPPGAVPGVVPQGPAYAEFGPRPPARDEFAPPPQAGAPLNPYVFGPQAPAPGVPPMLGRGPAYAEYGPRPPARDEFSPPAVGYNPYVGVSDFRAKQKIQDARETLDRILNKVYKNVVVKNKGK